MSRALRMAAAAMVAGIVAACAPHQPVRLPPGEEASAGTSDAHYRQLAARGGRVFAVEPSASVVAIEVRRGGVLSRLGHDHVIASRDVRGFVAPDEARADIHVRLDTLVVDEPELRAEAGFDTRPTDDDIAGTRRNMLKALEAERHPHALIRITRRAGAPPDAPLYVEMTIRGVVRGFEVPVQVQDRGDTLTAAGHFTLKQTDFGIAPLSVMGGAIVVQDEVGLRFVVRARAVD